MAVRHLKRYVSWVQTVQHFTARLNLASGGLSGLNPEVDIVVYETTNIADIITAAIHSNMYREANSYR